MALRVWALVALELRQAWKRPLWWVLAVLLLLLTWGLIAGNVQIGTGGSSANAERAWINSQFYLARLDVLIFALTYLFFVSVAFGNAVTDDDEHRVGPILHGTRLSMAEYVLGRWLGVAAVVCVILLLHFLVQVGFHQLYPVSEPDKLRDPAWTLWNYARPFLLFIAMPALCVGTFAFAVGAVTRQPVLVFLTPVAVLLLSIFLLWNFNPEWLPRWANSALCIADFTGYRWLSTTWLQDDRGAAFYNRTPIPMDAVFLLNRAWPLALCAAGLAWTVVVERRRLRHPYPVQPERAAQIIRQAPVPQAQPVAVEIDSGLRALGMTQRRPNWLRACVAQAGAEARELRRSPGLWIFVPLITLQVVGTAFFVPGWFDTPRLVTMGQIAQLGFNTVTLLSLFLLLFYATESLARDDRRRISPVLDSAGAPSSARLIGKLAANVAVVLVAVLLAVYAAAVVCLGVQALQSPHPAQAPMPNPVPLVQVWGFFLLPTVIAWMGMVALAWNLTRSRYAVYATGLCILTATGLLYVNGWVNWVGNWHLWDGVTWSDFGSFQLDRSALIMNRVGWLLVGALLIQVALMVERRRMPDPNGIASRMRWWPLARRALRTLPLAVPAAVVLIALAVQVRAGSGGGPRERQAKAYRIANAETWRNAKNPAIKAMDLDVTLDPQQGTFRVAGTYELENPNDAPLDRFALTPGPHYRDLKFAFRGAEHTAETAAEARKQTRAPLPVENSAGLWIFRPERALGKGKTAVVGFSYHGSFPEGIAKNTRGAGEFILPSGVVLNAFNDSFLPLVGWMEGIGLDAEDAPEPRRPEPDEWKKVTKPGLGSGSAMLATLRVTLPSQYRANAPGVLESDAADKDAAGGDAPGWHTMTWRTDQPVRFYNIVAAEWVHAQGERTSIWHLAEHASNVPSMLRALDGAHRWYSEWFYPYPFKELRLSEFPGMSTYAQGFGTNIVFSEAVGFRSRPTEESDAAFLIVAHEAAHQWWGNILMPGDGPGGNILSEGMAHYSTARLIQKMGFAGDGSGGERACQAFLRQIEKSYVEKRRADEERPMVEIDGARPGDETVTYDKGGWVFWMLHNLMGQRAADEGMHDFIVRFKDGPDYPLLQDLVQVLREHAPDKEAYDAFTQQWFLDVVLPEFRIESATVEKLDDTRWVTRATVKNAGTGTVSVQVAVTDGTDRWTAETHRSAATSVVLAPDTETAPASATVEIPTTFEPKKLVIDPDVRVLQMGRKNAERALP